MSAAELVVLWVGVGVSLLGAAAAVVMAALALRKQTEANSQASRSADASEASAVESRRSADASVDANLRAEQAALEADHESALQQARWRLTPGSDKDQFVLRNDGSHEAYDVWVNIQLGEVQAVGDPIRIIEPGQSEIFDLNQYLRDEEIVELNQGAVDWRMDVLINVEWRRYPDPASPSYRWRSELPPWVDILKTTG